MINSALAIAETWDAQLSNFTPHDGIPLSEDQEAFLFRVHARLSCWLSRLDRADVLEDRNEAEAHRAGVRYLEVLQVTVRTTLFKTNHGLVRKEAWLAYGRARSAGRRMTAMGFDDLVQEGEVGLATAIDQFDIERGLRFSTFAVRVIRRHIDRAIVSKEPLVYLPEHALQSLRRIREFTHRFRRDQGFLPSREEISKATGVTLETLEAIHAVGRRVSEYASDDGDVEPVCERIRDPNAVNALRVLVSSEVERIVDDAMQSLDSVEREVLNHRFGLGGLPELSQAEIAKRTGHSQQRIVQIEARALLKILIGACLRGVEAHGNEVLQESLSVLGDYGIGERNRLILLQRWLARSDRFRAPKYVRERLMKLEVLGLSPLEIGDMLQQDPDTIRISNAIQWRKRG